MKAVTITAIAVAATLAGSSVAMADGTVRFASIGDGYRHWGGIFNFEIVPDGPSAGYNGANWNTQQASLGGGYTTNQWAGEAIESGIGSSFGTFCLESGVDLGHLGGYFRGVISTSIDSGTAYEDWGGVTHTVLEPQTAFLYSSFRANSLTSVSGWNSASDEARANAVQGAIWLYQRQVDQNFVDFNGDGGQYTQQEVDLIAALQAYADDNANTPYWAALGNVRVLNLSWGAYQSGGTNGEVECQSVLVLIPLPPAAWAGLSTMAGIGLIGLVRRRRN